MDKFKFAEKLIDKYLNEIGSMGYIKAKAMANLNWNVCVSQKCENLKLEIDKTVCNLECELASKNKAIAAFSSAKASCQGDLECRKRYDDAVQSYKQKINKLRERLVKAKKRQASILVKLARVVG